MNFIKSSFCNLFKFGQISRYYFLCKTNVIAMKIEVYVSGKKFQNV